MFPAERLQAELLCRHMSQTSARNEVYTALGQIGPCRRVDLVRALSGHFDRRTVYRTIATLTGIDVITQLNSGLIELARPYKTHHHYIICPKCSKHTAFYNEVLEAKIQRIINNRRLDLISDSIELTAVCGQCRIKMA